MAATNQKNKRSLVGQALRLRSGQAATELAVFGAILIFLMGAIIRTAVSNGYQQNQALKTMRYALSKSWESAQKPGEPQERNTASILYLEDRMTPDFGKYGTMERVPYISASSASFSQLLFKTVDWNEPGGIPLMDVYINGKYFIFTTAAFVAKKPITRPSTVNATYPLTQPHKVVDSWLLTCKTIGKLDAAGQPVYKRDASGQVVKDAAGNSVQEQVYVSCPLFYTMAANGTDEFCLSNTCPGNALNQQEMFDLNRNGIYYPQDQEDPSIEQRPFMAWQWMAVPGIASEINPLIINTDTQVSYPVYDVDNDFKDETIYAAYTAPAAQDPVGIINAVDVLDGQEGDIDSGASDRPEVIRKPGLQQDAQIYTFTKEGTSLEIKEGKLYNPENGAFVRSASRKDSVDFIQRILQLSNDTHRFCYYPTTTDGSDAPGTPTACPNGGTMVKGVMKCDDNYKNPVEVCGERMGSAGNGRSSCFEQDKIKLTCFDKDSKILYIRSRIKDKRGHAWLTDAEGEFKFK